jgi:hypothetical protein
MQQQDRWSAACPAHENARLACIDLAAAKSASRLFLTLPCVHPPFGQSHFGTVRSGCSSGSCRLRFRQMPPPRPARASRGALAATSQLPAPASAELVDAACSAFTAGVNGVGLVGAVVFIGLALAVAMTFRPATQAYPAPSTETTGEAAIAA